MHEVSGNDQSPRHADVQSELAARIHGGPAWHNMGCGMNPGHTFIVS